MTLPTMSSAEDAVVFICIEPLFDTEEADQQLYQVLHNSPTERGRYVYGLPDPGDAQHWEAVTTTLERYQDSRFPRVKRLQAREGAGAAVLVRVCPHGGCRSCLGELTAPAAEAAARWIMLIAGARDPALPPLPPSVESREVSLDEVKKKFSLLRRTFPAGKRLDLSFAIRARLFPYVTSLATVVVLWGGWITMRRGLGSVPPLLAVATGVAAVVLAPRMISTVWAFLVSRFQEWRPRGGAAGATIREAAPEEVVVPVERCPLCQRPHRYRVSLRRWTVQYMYVPHWLDPFAPSLISSPRRIAVRLICPEKNQPFQATVSVRHDATQILAEGTTQSLGR